MFTGQPATSASHPNGWKSAAYRRNAEFVDLFDGLSWPMRAALYVALFYAILFFAARSQNEFIYFQF